MPETFTVDKFRYAGERNNPHGGVLHKFYVTLRDSKGAAVEDVYWQRKSDDAPSGEVYGHIEDGEYGPRFKTDQRPDGSGSQGSSGGTFNRHFERVPDNSDRSRRIERQHSQEMALRFVAIFGAAYKDGDLFAAILDEKVRPLIDWFVQDLDADVGGGPKSTEASPPTADVSAGYTHHMTEGGKIEEGPPPEKQEASPAQKGKLTQLFGKVGLSRDAMKAVVLFRCRSEKATKDGASKLIQDLMDGATHDTLLAEIYDAKRAGDPLAIRAAKLIPSDTPLAEPDPEVVPPNGDDKVPF